MTGHSHRQTDLGHYNTCTSILNHSSLYTNTSHYSRLTGGYSLIGLVRSLCY